MTPGDWVISEFLLLWYLSKMNHQVTKVSVPEYRSWFLLFICLLVFLFDHGPESSADSDQIPSLTLCDIALCHRMALLHNYLQPECFNSEQSAPDVCLHSGNKYECISQPVS